MTRPTRRSVLRGLAAAITLPWLPSLGSRAVRADATPPTRLVWWFCPNGMHMPAWTPTGEGTGWTPGAILEPVADLRSELTVISGLSNSALLAYAQQAPHPSGAASWLSCHQVTPDAIIAAETVDQVAAKANGHTAFPSLQAALQEPPGPCDPGFSCVYNENLSWSDPVTPVPAIRQPRLFFERLFGGAPSGEDEAARAARVADHRSVLDAVWGQASALQPRLSVEDRPRLDAYLTAVREVERQLDNPTTRACPAPAPPGDAADHDAAMALWVELLALTLECDLTRYLTFMVGTGGSNRVHSQIGVHESHHTISHHMGLQENFDKLVVIDRWEVEWWGRFLRRLQATPEGEGTLLDASLVVFGSECGDGNTHDHRDIPFALAGRANGRIEPGRHLRYTAESTANLHLATLHAANIPLVAFGEFGTRPLPGLLRS